jgi:hypothetical protein
MNATRKIGQGPKKRFAEIKSRLTSNNYNSATRKKNRNYLADYLKHRKNATSQAIATRVAEATGLLADINDYKSPSSAASVASTAPTASLASTTSTTSTASKSSPKKPSLYEQVDVKGDGNCFYRSLYRAAKEHEDPKMLIRVFDILGADKSKIASEESGQAALRNAIANYYKTKFLTRMGPFEMLKSNYGTRQFNGWVREATAKQAKIYKDIKKYAMKKDGKHLFYNDLASVIGTNQEYASDIDYMLIADILDNGGIKIVSSKYSPSGPVFDGKPALYIKRLSHNHYNYWRRISLAPANSNESTNEENETERHTLLEKLEAQMDSHARCVEKCRKLKVEVEATKAALMKFGKK